MQRATSSRESKSESVTFRIDSKALKNLPREAEQKDISTNTLVNQIIKEHLNWHSNAAKAGFIAVRRPFVTKIINYLSEQQIVLLAEYVANTANKDAVLLIKKEYTTSLYQFLLDELGVNKEIEFDKTENTLAFTIDSD
jgi:hypothetical protein